ncbi:MAG: hypothetical protein R8G01_12265 [Ilumatobacteraceae bacterium]|nr:hypothetical protein [Ilumatobacteraceae bacterium]
MGVAAHITGAAEGSARWNATLTRPQRRSLDNGIWLCQTHGKLVDDDEVRFCKELLHAWRGRAEDLARMQLGAPTFGNHGLLIHSRALSDPAALHSEIDEFLLDVGAREVWGVDLTDSVRLALFEVAQNDLEHGGATGLSFSSTEGAVTVRSNAPPFGVQDLITSAVGRGGRAAVEALLRVAEGLVDLVYRHDGSSEWSVITVDGFDGDRPCCISMDRNWTADALDELELAIAGCEQIHVYAPRLFAFSDARRVAAPLEPLLDGRQVVVHGIRDSGLRDWVSTIWPDAYFR